MNTSNIIETKNLTKASGGRMRVNRLSIYILIFYGLSVGYIRVKK